MEKMKHFILIFTAVMFLANTFAVSAWAKPCMKMDMSSMVAMADDADTPPCHEQQDQQKTAKHCNGVCLCLHAAISQTPTLSDGVTFDKPLLKTERVFKSQADVASMATAPPKRPPKQNS
jgi:hypothetical protein